MTAPSKLAPSEAVREAIAKAIATEGYDTQEGKDDFWEFLDGTFRSTHWKAADAALAAIAAQGLVLVPVAHLDALHRHYRENPPLKSKPSVDVREWLASRDAAVKPAEET